MWGESRADSWELAAICGKKTRDLNIIALGFQNKTYRRLAHRYSAGAGNIKGKVDKVTWPGRNKRLSYLDA